MFSSIKLKRPLGRSSNADLEDVFSVKTVLNDLGHYEVPDWGITKYPDNALFDGIKSLQQEYGLTIDGVMNPGGETEEMLNGLLQSRKPTRARSAQQEIQLAAVPAAPAAIPWIASQLPSWATGLAAALGLTLPLGGDSSKGDNCDYQLEKVDTPMCNQISKSRGKQAGQRCHASAIARHSACIKGLPPEQWPPLDTWNN